MTKNKKNHQKPNRRRLARACALRAIYQWAFTQDAPEHVAQHFMSDYAEDLGDVSNIDLDYFRVLVVGTLKQIEEIDIKMTPYLDRPILQLNPVELAALRLAFYELITHPEVPPPVVINEAIELTKEFGASEGYKFVNAVLNAFVKKNTREDEK